MNVVLSQAELFKGDTCRDLDLSSNNIDTGDLLCGRVRSPAEPSSSLTRDGVLHLDTRVDLDEVMTALLVHQELRSTGIAIIDRSRELERVVEDGLSDGFGQMGSRGDFDDLTGLAVDLVLVSDSAPFGDASELSSLAQTSEHSSPHHPPAAAPRYVGGDPRSLVTLSASSMRSYTVLTLDEHRSITKSALRLTNRPLKIFLEALLIPHNPHPSPTTSHSSFDDDREAVLLDEVVCFVIGLNWTRSSGHDGDLGLHGESTSFGLVSQGVDSLRSRTDECDPSIFHLLRKLVVFR